MSLPKDDAAVLSARWTEGVLLKRDVFSTVERGRFRDGDRRGRCGAAPARPGAVVVVTSSRAICSRANAARWRWPATSMSGRNCYGPAGSALVRGFIDGVALHLAKPHGDIAYFRSAKAALRKLHRAGICHNDLAKEQNWLRGSDGRAYLTDFQLAACFKSPQPAVPHRRLRGSAASPETQAQLRAGCADAEGAQDPCAQIGGRQRLADDRQEGLSRHHPRPVQFHRPRRRRPAAGQ